MDEGIMELDVLEHVFDGSLKPTDLKLSALQSITRNFSEERIIGTGGFGTVYKGVLQNGEVAVKRIKNNHTIDETVFRREVNNLLNVSHENIVRFLGFCSHTEHKVFENKGSRDYIYAENRERVLCFEYINNGSLERYIADELRGLQWDTRYFIIKGICEGLQYLHMEKQIIHMDLKPENILIDYNMVAKITDFGLSRMEENAQTKSTTRVSSPGYTAPEYIDKGEMSVKYDMYSLGIIIIEMVSGRKSIPDSNNVLRRWRHRLHKSGKGTPYRYQQITKLIEIGLLCQQKDPYKRPFISDIIRVINELESTDRKISNVNESTINPYSEDDMLGIEPLELHFPFKINSHISCSLELTNETNAVIAFIVQTTSPLPYSIQPNKDIVGPQSKYIVNITLRPLDKAPQDKYTGNFTVRSTKVKESLINEDITEAIFNSDGGKLVDEVNLTITYKGEVPQVDVSLGSLKISDTRNLHVPQESNVSPTETESKISVSTSDEVILFDPPELCFPLVPDKKVFTVIKIINITESYVSIRLSYSEENSANYVGNDSGLILPPWSTQWLKLTREEKEGAVKDTQFNDQVFFWYAIVSEDIEASDLDWGDYIDRRYLPIVLTKMKCCTSNELIQFDPPELSCPFMNKTSLSMVNIVNITDCYVGFNIWNSMENDVCYAIEPRQGILPPQSTRRILVRRVPKKREQEDMQRENKIFVWNMIVTEGVKVSNLTGCTDYEDSKPIPLSKKAIQYTTNELIQCDPPEFSLPFIPNKPLVFSVKIVNSTDYYVGFKTLGLSRSVGRYYIKPMEGVMPPRSTRRLVVKKIPKQKEQEDMQCEDKFFLWSSTVSEGIDARDFFLYANYEDSKELRIVYKKTSLLTSEELIQFDPPQLPFTFLPSKRVSMLQLFNIVNLTVHSVGFTIWSHEDNSAQYAVEPNVGILPPQSTQAIKVRRTPKEKELEDKQWKDKIFVWNGIVTEGVKVSDVSQYWMDEDKEFPVVLSRITSSSSVELIKFEPPEVCFPFVPSKRLISSIKIVNITDHHIGFNTRAEKTNVALYIMEPPYGVLPPWSTQELVVTRVAKEDTPELEDIQCKDKYFVWTCIATADVNASDLTRFMVKTDSKELPIVFTETSSNELIQFDPPELFLPLLPNQRVLSTAKIVNITDQHIGFKICTKKSNSARYNTNPSEGILPPLSTKVLLVTRISEENDTQCKDRLLVWNGIVTQDVKASDVIDNMSETKCTELPIVITKKTSSTSDELIQFDPPELQFPFLPNKKVLTSIKILNLTDYNVGFNTYSRPTNVAWYNTEPPRGILPPRSTQKLMVTREEKEDALKDKHLNDKYFVWKSIISEGVKDSDLSDYMADEESMELPIVLDKTSSSISDELIQLDPAELCIPLLLNKTMLLPVNVVNVTDFNVAFNAYYIRRNAEQYTRSMGSGILPPRSNIKFTMGWVTIEKELEDMEPEVDYFVWNRAVTECVESGDIIGYMGEEDSKKLPLILYKTTPCTSNELIQFDPPELSLPFMPNKPLVFSVDIVNNTDYHVCFDKYQPQTNVGWYYIEPAGGVIPPRSTQRLVVKRVPDEKEQDAMQCEDKFFLWSSLGSEGVEASDIDNNYIDYEGSKELPIVYKKTSLSTSDELIQIDPPQLGFSLPNKSVSMLRKFKIVNVTDHIVGYCAWPHEDSSAWYIMEPRSGILPPQSTQSIKVRRTPKEKETEDMQHKDKIFVWNGIVTEGIEASDVDIYWKDGDKELPVVLTKPGENSSR